MALAACRNLNCTIDTWLLWMLCPVAVQGMLGMLCLELEQLLLSLAVRAELAA
jgi:hypothetical protein